MLWQWYQKQRRIAVRCLRWLCPPSVTALQRATRAQHSKQGLPMRRPCAARVGRANAVVLLGLTILLLHLAVPDLNSVNSAWRRQAGEEEESSSDDDFEGDEEFDLLGELEEILVRHLPHLLLASLRPAWPGHLKGGSAHDTVRRTRTPGQEREGVVGHNVMGTSRHEKEKEEAEREN